MPVKSSDTLGVVARAFALLVRLAGDNLGTVLHCFQQIIDDPLYRRQVWSAMTGKLVITDMTKQEWIERETQAMIRSGLLDEKAVVNDELRIEQMADAGDVGIDYYFIPSGLTCEQLIDDLARNLGMKVTWLPYGAGDEGVDNHGMPTETGVLECDLGAIGSATGPNHRPFDLNYDDHLAYVKEQEGSDLTSAEETLYLLIRYFLTFGRTLSWAQQFRCRNRYGSVSDCDHICAGFNCNGTLRISWKRDVNSDRWCGAIPRKFTPLKT